MPASTYSQMAKQFLELWQKQMGAVMNDRDFISAMMEMMQSMSAVSPQPADVYAKYTNPSNTSPAPDALLERLDQLDYRIRMLEKLAAESDKKPKPAGKKSAAKPSGSRKPRSAQPAGKPAKKR